MKRPELSMVLPVFNEEAVIGELGRRLVDFLAGTRFVDVPGPRNVWSGPGPVNRKVNPRSAPTAALEKPRHGHWQT